MFFVNKEDCTKTDDSFLSLNKNKRAGVEYWPKVVRLLTFVFPLCLQYSVNFLSPVKTQTSHFPKPCKKEVSGFRCKQKNCLETRKNSAMKRE